LNFRILGRLITILYSPFWIQADRLANVYFAPYGVGLGHASRLVMIAEGLQYLGVTFKFSTFGEAARYLSCLGYSCNIVPPMEFGWTSEGHFSISSSIANIPRFFVNFSRQVNHEIRNMIKFRPDIVVSDTRLSPVLASKILHIPSIVILNQVKLLLSPRLRRYKVTRIFEALNGEVLGLGWTLTDKILIPDLPPPHTISENNVWGTNSVRNKLEYVGFTTPKTHLNESNTNKLCAELGLNRAAPIVFVHVSGPFETRMPLVRVAMDASKASKEYIQFIISAGYPGGNPQPKSIQGGWFYEWCPVRDEIFSLSDIIVIRGGHAAISQAIKFGKPIVAIPIENHGEQLGNSQKIARLGIGVAITTRPLRPEDVSDAIKLVLNNPSYLRRANELRELSEKLNGIDNIVRIVQSFIS
jgi:UDP-N-acetylglucosamine--N-acetylmuramyl-(pentapeptide) pyrophosphoryl-undecaprenol N-acetylglucosamine transferase